MVDRIYRKDKIIWFVGNYLNFAERYDDEIPMINQIIIDSVGISGLKEVKRRAWKNHY